MPCYTEGMTSFRINNKLLAFSVICICAVFVTKVAFFSSNEKMASSNNPQQSVATAQSPTPSPKIYPAITPENYPQVSFLPGVITVAEADFADQGWQTWTAPDASVQMQFPEDWMSNGGDETGVGFCLISACQDFHPVLEIRSEPPEEIFDSKVNCKKLKTCNGANIAVSSIRFGDRTGQVWWVQKLTREEVQQQKDATGPVMPLLDYPAGTAEMIVLENEGTTYVFSAYLSRQTHKQMLSTLRFR